MSRPAVIMDPPAANTITKEAARLRATSQLQQMKAESPWRVFTIVGPKKDVLIVQVQQPDRWHPDLILHSPDGLPVFTFHVVAVATKADYDLAVQVFSTPKFSTLAKSYPTLHRYQLPQGRSKTQLRQHFSAGDTTSRHYAEPA